MVVKKAPSPEKKKKSDKSTEKKGAAKMASKVSEKSKKIGKDKQKSDDKTNKTLSLKKKESDGNRMTRRFNKLRLKKSDLDGSKGIVYIGHLPRGFEEEELRKFFEQFGKISKIRLSRSKKTARSRGYAFLEFKDKEVAAIAVNTMDKYIIFGKQIQCHLIEPELAHKDMFNHGNREWVFIPTALKFRNKKNAEQLAETEGGKTQEQKIARVEGLLQKEKEKRVRLKELGIEYEFPGYQGLVDSLKGSSPAKKSGTTKERKTSSDSTKEAEKKAMKKKGKK